MGEPSPERVGPVPDSREAGPSRLGKRKHTGTEGGRSRFQRTHADDIMLSDLSAYHQRFRRWEDLELRRSERAYDALHDPRMCARPVDVLGAAQELGRYTITGLG
ncbi:hypothetical protein BGW38_010490, partial [Lunasporangiospora selenospora]